MPITLKRYMRSLTASGLMSAADVKAFLRKLPPDEQPADAQELAKLLVRTGWLTRYQAAMLYRGMHQGLVLGNYAILDKIGAGGMGQVFKAEHRRMQRTVALKVLPREAMKSKEAIHRFDREVRAAARLSHPHIVTAYDSGEAGGTHFLVMEYIAGANLAEVVQERGPLGVEDAAAYIVQAARGLAYAHARGVVHRDVKPSNLLLDETGRVKILDMGLASIRERIDEAATHGRSITTTGQVVGTVEYMAPEQAEDTRQADHRSDIYGLGCTLFRLLTGELPYRGGTVVQLILAHREHSVPSLRAVRRDIPAEVDSIFQKMVAKTPSDRYQSMDEVIQAFERAGLARMLGDPAGGARSTQAAGRAPAGELSFSTPAPAARGKRRSGWPLLLPTLLVLLAVAALRSTRWEETVGPPQRVKEGPASGFAELPSKLVNSIGMELVLVAPGDFLMGSSPEEAAAARNAFSSLPGGSGELLIAALAAEQPRHVVRVSEPFYMAAHEVTVRQFGAFVMETQSDKADATAQESLSEEKNWPGPAGMMGIQHHPVVQVTWRQASAFCEWLSQREHQRYRLPTEAEWEFACRAGSESAWCFSSPAEARQYAWFGDNAQGRTHRVGLLMPNALGLYDMHGNVLEWCLDGPRTYEPRGVTDPAGPPAGTRVVRGGDYGAPNAWCLRSAMRVSCPDRASPSIGFRVVRAAR